LPSPQRAETGSDVATTSIRRLRDQLDARIVQRFRQQTVGRVVSGSFLRGVHSSHDLESFDHHTQAEVNRMILNHRPNIRSLLALASTCRLLRAHAEPFLYRFADLDYGSPSAYAQHLELLLQYPHLAKYVRLLSLGNFYDQEFGDDWYGFLPLNPIRLSQAFDHLLAQDAPVSRSEIYRHLGPDRFGPYGLHPSVLRAMFLFVLPNVWSLKFDLALPGNPSHAEQTRREWLFRALLRDTDDIWTAGRVPALRNLEEFSLILRGDVSANSFDPRLLLPVMFLPKIRMIYTSSLATAPSLILNERQKSQWSAKSPVTEMVFDFAAVDGFTLDSLLRLPRALEKLTVNFTSAHPGTWNASAPWLADLPTADRAVGDAFLHQRHSLRTLTIRWAHAHEWCSIDRLQSFTVLEELTAPLIMVISHPGAGEPCSLCEALPASIVSLQLLAYGHVPVPVWHAELLRLLRSKQVLVPNLRRVRIEHWLRHTDDPVSAYEVEANAVVSLGRQVGVKVQVEFRGYRPGNPEAVQHVDRRGRPQDEDSDDDDDDYDDYDDYDDDDDDGDHTEDG
jgi:hypothetical protein